MKNQQKLGNCLSIPFPSVTEFNTHIFLALIELPSNFSSISFFLIFAILIFISLYASSCCHLLYLMMHIIKSKSKQQKSKKKDIQENLDSSSVLSAKEICDIRFNGQRRRAVNGSHLKRWRGMEREYMKSKKELNKMRNCSLEFVMQICEDNIGLHL